MGLFSNTRFGTPYRDKRALRVKPTGPAPAMSTVFLVVRAADVDAQVDVLEESAGCDDSKYPRWRKEDNMAPMKGGR